MANEQNSFNCSEESCINPFADSYLCLQNVYSLCSEEAVSMRKGQKHTEESKRRNYEAHKGMYVGDKNPFYGKHHTEESNLKNSQAHIGRVPWNKGKTCPQISKALTGRHPTEATLQKLSESHTGQVAWNKGTKGVIVSWNKGNRRCCSVETIKRLSESHKGIIPSEETLRKRSDALKGENHYNWKGGISFDPYCSKFNKQLKEHIRERDNHTCQLCPCTEEENKRKLSVHHVHYDKENCKPDLITLCVKCNTKVNQSRDYWEEYFINKLKERGLVL